MPYPVSRKLAVIGALFCSTHAPTVFAKFGCESVGKVSYRIGTEYESSGITIGGDIPSGHLVATGTGVRSGPNIVMECKKGFITFDHEWTPVSSSEIRPLTIGGLPSGLGLKAAVHRKGSEHFRFPSVTHWNLDNGWFVPGGTPVETKDESVLYDIVRTPGPLRFGRIDSGVVARSFGTNSKGGGRLHYEDVEMANVAIHRPPCSIVVDDLNQTVKMGDYTVSDFANSDKATPWTPFHLRVASCSHPSGLIARFTFGVTSDASPGNAAWFSLPPGGPERVAMQLGTHDLRNIAPATPVSLNALGNGQRYTFHARLKQTSPNVRGGRFSRHLRLMVEYL